MSCWRHRWTKWKEIRRGRYIIQTRLAGYITDKRPGGIWIEQERTCERCGQIQIRTAEE